jgi:hypothetical protein
MPGQIVTTGLQYQAGKTLLFELAMITILNLIQMKCRFCNKALSRCHIPILPFEELKKQKPGYILIVLWNLRGKIIDQLAFTGEWGARFVTAIPLLQVFEPVKPVTASNGKADVSEI